MALGRLAHCLSFFLLAVSLPIQLIPPRYSYQPLPYSSDAGLSYRLSSELIRQTSKIQEFSLTFWLKVHGVSTTSTRVVLSICGSQQCAMDLSFHETGKLTLFSQYSGYIDGLERGGKVHVGYAETDRNWHFIGVSVSMKNRNAVLCKDSVFSEISYEFAEMSYLANESVLYAAGITGSEVLFGRLGDLVFHTNTYMSTSGLQAVRTAQTALSPCTPVNLSPGAFYDGCQEFALLAGLSLASQTGGYAVDFSSAQVYSLSDERVFYGRSYSGSEFLLAGWMSASSTITLSGTSSQSVLRIDANFKVEMMTETTAALTGCTNVDGFVYVELEVKSGGGSLKCSVGVPVAIGPLSEVVTTITLFGYFYNLRWIPTATALVPAFPLIQDFDPGCDMGTGSKCNSCKAGYVLQEGRCAQCHPYCATCTAQGYSHCQTCASGSYFQGGLSTTCRPFCPTGYTPNTSQICTQTSAILRSATFENNVAGDFSLPTGERLRYGMQETYYPNYDFMDPLPVNKRGVYMKFGTIEMRWGEGLILGTEFSFEFWVMPYRISDLLEVGQYPAFCALCLNIGQLSRYILTPEANQHHGPWLELSTVGGVNPRRPAELEMEHFGQRWFHIGLSIEYQQASQQTIATLILDNQSKVYIFPGYFEMQEEHNIYFGWVGNMYLYSFSFLNKPRSHTEFTAMEGSCSDCSVCPVALEQCLPLCKPSEFVDAAGECQACLPECELGCVNGDSCHFCADPRCLKCSGYDSLAICLQCIEGATLQSGLCVCSPGQLVANNTCIESCNSGFFPNYASGRCQSCAPGCLECDFQQCSKCQQEFLLIQGICTCDTGFFISSHLTCEKCDSICTECSQISSNCTSCPTSLGYYLTSGTCADCQETAGYEGGLGINQSRGAEESLEHYINQVCKEKCGDGELKGQLECDDGNRRDGDGCSSSCTVELSWKCLNISGISVCKDETPPTAELIYSELRDSEYLLLLTFSENVTYPGDTVEIQVEIDLIQLYTIEQTVISQGITAVQIGLKAQERVQSGAVVTVTFPTPSHIRDFSGNSLATKQVSANLTDNFTPVSSLTVSKAAQVTGPMAGAVASMAVLNTAFSSSNFNAVWSLVDILQLINYILYMSVALPDNLKSFLRQLSFANFEFIPSFFESARDEFPAPPVSFENEGVGTDFLINIGNMVTIWTALICAFLVLVVLCKCLPNVSVLFRLKSLFVYSVFIRCGTESFLQLSLAVCLQLREASPQSIFGGFSLAASLLISLYLCFLLTMTVTKVSLQTAFHLSQKPYIIRFGSLYETFKLESCISRSFLLLQNFRRLSFVLFLVFLSPWPLLQALLCFALSLLYLAALIVWRPGKDWWLGNFSQILSEAGLSLVHCLICVLADDGLSMDLRTRIGWGALAILLVLIFANIGVMAYIQFQAMKLLFSRVNVYLSSKRIARAEIPSETERTWSEDFKRVPVIVPHTEPSFGDPETAADIKPVFEPIKRL